MANIGTGVLHTGVNNNLSQSKGNDNQKQNYTSLIITELYIKFMTAEILKGLAHKHH